MQRTALLSRKGRYNCILLSWFIYILPFTVCRQLTCIFDLSSDYLVRTTFRWGWRGWILETGGYGDDTRVSICCTQRCTTFRCIKNSTMDTTSQPTCFSSEHRNGERYLTIVLCGINIILTPITILFLTMPKQAQEISPCTSGCPKKLAELIRAGNYDPSCVHKMTTADLKVVCAAADIYTSANITKVSKYK